MGEVEYRLFEFLAGLQNAEGDLYHTYALYNSIFKENELLSKSAFINGRLVRLDDLEKVVRSFHQKGWVSYWGNSAGGYFKLTDAGVIELGKRQSENDGFSSPPDDLVEKRWSRLRQIVVDGSNADQISGLIDKSLDEISKLKLSNEEHRQASAFMIAAKELVNAPAPPSKIIWDLIQKAAAIAGIVQLLLPIFSILN